MRSELILLVLLAVPMVAQETSNPLVFTINNPVPSIGALTPNHAVVGGSDFTLTVDGSNFALGSVVRWVGQDRVTAFINNSRLEAAILSTDIATIGTFAVTAFNPAPGGGESLSLPFQVEAQPTLALALTQLVPDNALAGGSGLTLIVLGAGFTSDSVVLWGEQARPTMFVSSTELAASITVFDLQVAGTVQITVLNPSPQGRTVYFNHDFEDGTSGPFSNGGSVTTEQAFSGTKSAKLTLLPNSGNVSQLFFAYPDNVPLNEPDGLWQRWYVYFPQSTLDSVEDPSGSGFKHALNRGFPQSFDPPSWIMISINNPDSPFKPDWGFFPDTTLDCGELDGVNNCRGLVPIGGTWIKVKTHYKKNPDGSALAEVWIDDVLQINDTDPVMGSTDPAQRPEIRLGIAFTSNSGPNGLVVYVDEVFAGNFDPDA